jgi:acyl carrier protein
VAVQEESNVNRPEPAEFVKELKALVLDAAEKSEPAGGLGDDEILFGEQSRLALDSLDALQISMAIQQRYGVRMTDSKETRRALSSLAFLAEYLQARLP